MVVEWNLGPVLQDVRKTAHGERKRDQRKCDTRNQSIPCPSLTRTYVPLIVAVNDMAVKQGVGLLTRLGLQPSVENHVCRTRTLA